MKTCPICKKNELDVTGEGIPCNPYYRCWNCGFGCYRNQFKKFKVEE